MRPRSSRYLPLSGPPALGTTQQAELRAAVQELPAEAGIGMANWNWKVVHRFVRERWSVSLSRFTLLSFGLQVWGNVFRHHWIEGDLRR